MCHLEHWSTDTPSEVLYRNTPFHPGTLNYFNSSESVHPWSGDGMSYTNFHCTLFHAWSTFKKREVLRVIVEIGWMTLSTAPSPVGRTWYFLSLPKKKPYILQQWFFQLFSKVLIRRGHSHLLSSKRYVFREKSIFFFWVICTSNNWVTKILLFTLENNLWIQRKLVQKFLSLLCRFTIIW